MATLTDFLGDASPLIVVLVALFFALIVILARRRPDDPGHRAFYVDGQEIRIVPVLYDGIKGIVRIVGKGKKEAEAAWLIPTESKPQHWFYDPDTDKRYPIVALIAGDIYARKINAKGPSDELREVLAKSRLAEPGDHLTEPQKQQLKTLGITLTEPLSMVIIGSDNTIDNRELARLIDAPIREAFRDPGNDSMGVLVGGVIGITYGLMFASYVPADLLNSNAFSTILMVVILAAFGGVYMLMDQGV